MGRKEQKYQHTLVCWYQLHAFLGQEVLKTASYSYCWLDYCNSFYMGLPLKIIRIYSWHGMQQLLADQHQLIQQSNTNFAGIVLIVSKFPAQLFYGLGTCYHFLLYKLGPKFSSRMHPSILIQIKLQKFQIVNRISNYLSLK